MNDPNFNILLSGESKMYAVEDLALTGTTDGFIMRVTPLGFV